MSDDHPCPTCGADHFKSRSGMKCHHAKVHDERLIDTATCDHCGEEFEPTSKGVYCSPECCAAANRDRVTLECDHCESSFEVSRARVDRRRFCSPECRHAALRKRVTLECDHCGDEYEALAGEQDARRFCSVRCSTKYKRDRIALECEQCGRTFRTHPCHADQKYCCPECRYEAIRTSPREYDTADDLLRQLYVDEDYDLNTTFRRQRAVRGEEAALFKKQVRQRLIDLGVFKQWHLAAATAADPDSVGGPAPDGDDSWRQFYDGGAADD